MAETKLDVLNNTFGKDVFKEEAGRYKARFSALDSTKVSAFLEIWD